MSTSILEQSRESIRLQQVYNTMLRYGWDIGLGRWPTINAFRHRMQAWVWHLPPDVDLDAVSTPAKARMMLEDLGPTYVKMGQIISSQSSVIPPEWGEELAKLQSSVPPFPADQVRAVIIEELGKPPEELYASFEPMPFAAASTAQVHRATLPDGTLVAVKVQRPGIHHQMRADLGIMENASTVLARRSEAVRAVDLPGMVEQFSNSVLNELNYTGEAYNAHILNTNLAALPGIHFPTMYYELCTSRVLTMEFITGVKINNIAAIEGAGLNRELLARNALRAMIKMLLIDGFFHADPHPGNLLVNLETGTINFLDTGMVGELSLKSRLTVIQLIMAFQNRDLPGMAHLMVSLSTPFVDDVDEDGFVKEFERMVGGLLLKGGDSPNFGAVITDAMELLRRYGLRLDPDLTMAIKALMQAEAVSSVLYPQGGISEIGVELIRELAVQEITADKVAALAKQQVAAVAREVLKELPSFQDATLSWLKQYRKGRFEVYVDTSSLGQEISKLNRIGQLVVIGIILAGMLVGSAIATLFLTQSTGDDAWRFIGRLAYLGYIFSMFIAVIVVLRLIWLWWRGRDKV